MTDAAFAHLVFSFAIFGAASAGYCTVRLVWWARERWRTRHDKGYDAHKWGAY